MAAMVELRAASPGSGDDAAAKDRCSGSASSLKRLFCPQAGQVAGDVSQQLDGETRSLLRTRLRASAVLFFVGWTLLMFSLRVSELVIFGGVMLNLLIVHLQVPEMMYAQRRSAPELVALYRFVLAAYGIIAAYGMFIPNTWRRTLAITLPMAMMPFLTLTLATVRDPGFGVALAGAVTFEDLSFAVLVMSFAVSIATYGAHVVRSIRRQVAEAREMGLYRLRERIGAGGMGEVWRAEHELLTRPAAIKMIRPEVLGVEAARRSQVSRRFKREAQVTAALRSPHTVELYDFGVTNDGTFYYVMEFLDGLDLDTLVKDFGPQPAERVIHILEQATESLAEAHGSGLIHRDIKPSNLHLCVMGVRHDFVKVLDFGLVKPKAQKGVELTELTSDQTTTGTPAYMPPEMALGDRPVDARTDMYALGCVAYWLLTGKLLFESGSPIEMIVDHVKTTPTPPSQRTDNAIPAALERLVLRMVAKDPDDRPADMMTLARELAECAGDQPWTQERAATWWRQHMPPRPVLSVA